MNQIKCSFYSSGKDGYDVLAKKRRIVDEEAGIPLSTAVINYFRTISVLSGFTQTQCKFRTGLISMKQRNRVSQALLASFEKFTDKNFNPDEQSNPSEKAVARWVERTQDQLGLKLKEKFFSSFSESGDRNANDNSVDKPGWGKIRQAMFEKEKECCRVAPKVEGRIVRLDGEN